MRAAWRRWLSRLRTAPRAEDGVAAVEFALIVPIMLLVYIGAVEASALISMDRRVQSVAGTLGDLVARSDGKIASSLLADFLSAATGIMAPYPATELHQVVSQVQVQPDGTATIVWSQRYDHTGESFLMRDGHAVAALYALPPEMIVMASTNKFVIVSEVSYDYLPLYGIVFNKPVKLRRENFFMPRFGDKITLN